MYVCVGFDSDEVEPSPKFQVNASMVPVEVLVNVTGKSYSPPEVEVEKLA